MTIYEVTYYPADLQLQNKDLGNVYSVVSLLSAIYFGLHHRGLHFESLDVENLVRENIKANQVTLKLVSQNLEFRLKIEVIKSIIPTNIRVTLSENFESPSQIGEKELIERKKVYEILKDSFIYTNNIYLLSDNYEGHGHHYENRIFNPIECIKPLISSIESLNFDSIIKNEDIEIEQYINIKYIHGGELTTKVILKSRCESPSDFWIFHRGEEFYRKYYKSNFDILNYVCRQGDLAGNCLNLNGDEKENLINRLNQFRYELLPTSIMQMGTTGYIDEYFCETIENYTILIFHNEM